MIPCPSRETLELLITGELTAETTIVRDHVTACLNCQAVLDRLSDHPAMHSWQGHRPNPDWADEACPHHLLDRLRTTTLLVGPPVAIETPDTIGPYRIDGVLGSGGMGVVYKAYDPALARVVAVKVLVRDWTNERARTRFVREARAAAGLDHPNVVPVHEVENPPGAPPYLVMPYVAGATLRERIAAERALQPRAAADVVAQVADGLAAAHAAGLIHRDIKPANILLDAETGRARITDFGLVRVRESEGLSTQEGTTPGTPEYMSPEQIGASPAVDARSDIYNLGVTLYEALTGSVPFRGALPMILQQVLTDDPVPPRRLSDRIPRDVETICLKAMAKEPGRRYATAADLAADLRRWLAGEPVLARPMGAIERGWRWCRRRPALAGVTGALAVSLVAGLAVTTTLWLRADRARQHAEGETTRAEAEAVRAEAGFRQARKAANESFTLIAEGRLSRRPGMHALRKELLEAALRYNQDFIRQRADDPTVRAELADAHFRIGRAKAIFDADTEALEHFGKAQAEYEKLAINDPSAAVRFELGQVRHHAGLACQKMGRAADALEHYTATESIFRQLIEAEPGRRDLHSAVGITLQARAAALELIDRGADALASYQAAIDVQRHALTLAPANPESQEDLADHLHALAVYHLKRNQLAEPLPLLTECRERLRDLQDRYPLDAELVKKRAITETALASLHRRAGRPTPAMAHFQQGRELHDRLVRDSPEVLEYRAALGAHLNNMGVLLKQTGELDQALACFRDAIRHQRDVITRAPQVRQYREHLQFHYAANLIPLLLDRGRGEEAATALKDARTFWEALIERFKDAPEYRSELAVVLNDSAFAFSDHGRRGEAVAAFRLAIGHQQVALALAPGTAGYLKFLERHYNNAAAELLALRRPAELAELARQRAGTWPTEPNHLFVVARHLAECVALAAAESERDEYGRESAARLKQAIANGFTDTSRLSGEKRFDPVRGRADFRAAVEDLVKRSPDK